MHIPGICQMNAMLTECNRVVYCIFSPKNRLIKAKALTKAEKNNCKSMVFLTVIWLHFSPKKTQQNNKRKEITGFRKASFLTTQMRKIRGCNLI